MIAARLVAAVGAWLMAAVALAIATGAARSPWAWAIIGGLFAVVPGQLAWSLSGGRRRRLVVAVALAAGMIAGAVVVASTPLAPRDLRDVGARFVVADTWRLRSESIAGVNGRVRAAARVTGSPPNVRVHVALTSVVGG